MRRAGSRWRRIPLCFVFALSAGCPSEPVEHPVASATPTSRPPVSLRVPFVPLDFADNPALLHRLQGTVFGYYRFINGPFTERVCEKYDSVDSPAPDVNLHGDAHLEQYAVADDGRGLADFDAASMGPAVVDLLRFSTSLWLAAHGRFNDGDSDRAVSRFLEGYEKTLADPQFKGSEPKASARIRARFEVGSRTWLNQVEGFMLPMTDAQRERLSHSATSYVDEIVAQNPDFTRSFFAIKKAGSLKMGIGSAHEAKFLARVEGPTTADDDDVILETKQVIGRAMGSCVHGGEWGDALRVIVGQARLSESPQRFLGHVEIEGKKFYVHAWRVHYTELAVADVHSGDELGELAFDVGLQLGRGHPKQLAGPHEADLRKRLDAYVKDNQAMLHSAPRDLAAETVDAWTAFRHDSGL